MMTEMCYYDAYLKQLTGSIISKARKFNKLKCIVPTEDDRFLCKPVAGYNKTTYTITFNPATGNGSCSCQHNEVEGKTCSHIAGVALFLKLKHDNDPVNISKSILRRPESTGISFHVQI